MSRFTSRIVTAPFPPGETFESLIDGYAAVCFRGFAAPEDVAAMVKGVYDGKEVWSEAFGGEQFALGDAWYHYAEEDIDFDEYGSKAEQSRANVEKYVPGLEKKVLDYLKPLAGGGALSVREGWAGPGFMLFPAGQHVSRLGGSIHYDTDAFDTEELEDPDLVMFSFVAMVQKPESGGNLMIWDKHYDPALPRDQYFDPSKQEKVDSCLVDYQPGDLWMLRGMNAHQIGSFPGKIDRICLTFHIVKDAKDWLMWF